jgi:hypothetical protein
MFTTIGISNYTPIERQATALYPKVLRQESPHCISIAHTSPNQQPSRRFLVEIAEPMQLWAEWVNIVTDELAQFGAVSDILSFGEVIHQRHGRSKIIFYA